MVKRISIIFLTLLLFLTGCSTLESTAVKTTKNTELTASDMDLENQKHYYAVGDISDCMLVVCDENKYFGFVNNLGEEVIPLKYEKAYDFIDGKAIVKLNGKYGFIDKTGKTIIPFEYSELKYFSDGLALAQKDGKYGFIDENGNTKIAFGYKDAYSYSENLSAVRKDGKYGYIDTKGDPIIPFVFDNCGKFRGGFAAVKKEGKWGIINKDGETILPFDYDTVYLHSDGIVYAEKNQNYNYIDLHSQLLYYDNTCIIVSHNNVYRIPLSIVNYFNYDSDEIILKTDEDIYINSSGEIYLFSDYSKNTLTAFDLQGKLLFEKSDCFAPTKLFEEGLLPIRCNNSKIKYIDKKGDKKIELSGNIKTLGGFSDGLAAVMDLDGKVGFIDKNGEFIIQPMFNCAELPKFTEGVAVLNLINSPDYVLINKKGEEILTYTHNTWDLY